MSNEVIWYDSSETGAPVLTNTAGALIAILDACLINGFNVKAVTSIVVASDVATVTCAGHGYSGIYGKLVKISGATPAGLNGRKQITPVGVNSFTFPTTGISDQAATGTISARRAPLETWEKPFTGTNKAMYRSTDTGATGAILRLDDGTTAPCAANYARAIMVESATDIDTYVNPCPTNTLLADGKYWGRTSSGTACPWRVIGDGRFFWLISSFGSQAEYAQFFGDFKSYKALDGGNAIISGPNTGGGTNYTLFPRGVADADGGSESHSLLRSVSGVTTAVVGENVPTIAGISYSSIGTGVANHPVYPSPVDGGLLIAYPTLLKEAGKVMRGEVPALGYPIANMDSVPDMTLITGLNNSARTFLMLRLSSYPNYAAVMFDLTGPWR